MILGKGCRERLICEVLDEWANKYFGSIFLEENDLGWVYIKDRELK